MSVTIYLGGQQPSPQLAHKVANQAELVIAADSGYDSCRQNQIVPHVITGDFDSIQSLPDSDTIKIIPAKEQTATDFEKALRLVPENTRQIDILGGTGLRSDHFLTNLLIATEQPAQRSVVFHDDQQTLCRVTPECSYEANPPIGSIISLIPFSTCSGTSSTGLFWDLQRAEMGPNKQFGQSNRVAQSPVTVSIQQGCLFVVVNQLQ